MQAVMLVGGQGTRLRPLTVTTPKPMLPLMNGPFLEFMLKHLRDSGVNDVILSTSYLSSVFESHFGNGAGLGMKLTYVTEEHPLDTCGAVKNVEQYLEDAPFLVFNGDILTDLDLGALVEFHKSKQAHATLTLTRVEDPTAYGLVPLDESGRVIEFLEKPSPDEVVTDLINAGTYVLERDVLDLVPDGVPHSFERQLFPKLLELGRPVFGFPSPAYWLDIGTPEKYLQAHWDILDRRLSCDYKGEEIKPGVWVEEGTVIEEGATVFGPTCIGRDCRIAAGAHVEGHTVICDGCTLLAGSQVERSLLHDGCQVGEESIVRSSILAPRVKLGRQVHVSDAAVLGEGMIVKDGNDLRHGIKVWPNTVIEAGKVKF
ncbi:MAG: sugar phosphate nucleotidyltransferase [Candidatus Geothermincolia bacterium]